jgi:hypothetical protein
MAKSIRSIYKGIDYQARIFWLQACQALYSDSKIDKVGYEIDGVKSFDDVAVIYKTPILSVRNEPIKADYWQVKYHVDASGSLTYEQLIIPKFINAKTTSILQRLHQAQNKEAESRFYFVSPWLIQPDDALAKLVSNNNGEIRLETLLSTTAMMRRVRKTWKVHLGLSSDDELISVIRPLRIQVAPSLQQMNDNLNAHLVSVGLVPVDKSAISNPYDELISKLYQTGETWFSKDDIENICKREGLWKGKKDGREKTIYLGIRSFSRWAENMENETRQMLNLVPYFDDRAIHSPQLWQEKVLVNLNDFLQQTLNNRCLYALHLDCHLSIAFAAGYFIGTKSGFEVAPVQKTLQGKKIWRINNITRSVSNLWVFSEKKTREENGDVALFISITHPIENDVHDYIKTSLSNITREITCSLQSGSNNNAISDGQHAFQLAVDLVQWLRQNRSPEEKQAVLHIFSAAPNGFLFLLGQQATVLGNIQLYEHNFENPSGNDYQPSIRLFKE